MRQPEYLVTAEAAKRLRRSPRSLRELTRKNAVPLRKLPYTQGLLFIPDELDLWVRTGCSLEVIELDGGGRIVRPAASGNGGPKFVAATENLGAQS
jgi:hypothetical protein